MKIIKNGYSRVLLFIHGGPGLDSSYFEGWFGKLNSLCDLAFYDQTYSCGSSNILDDLCKELHENIIELSNSYKKIMVFAHSWGAFLYLRSMAMLDNIKAIVDKSIFSNPMATTWYGFNKAGNRLLGKMPKSIIDEIASCADGLRIMDLILPYYVGSRECIPDLTFAKYDLDACNAIFAAMEGYDLSGSLYMLEGKAYFIYCENDFENASDSYELSHFGKVFFFKNAGHFPFAEYNSEFIALLTSIIS